MPARRVSIEILVGLYHYFEVVGLHLPFLRIVRLQCNAAGGFESDALNADQYVVEVRRAMTLTTTVLVATWTL
jgi:hypothetical protein